MDTLGLFHKAIGGAMKIQRDYLAKEGEQRAKQICAILFNQLWSSEVSDGTFGRGRLLERDLALDQSDE